METGPLPRVVDGPRRVSPASPSMLAAFAVLLVVELVCRVGTRERWNASTVDAWLRRVPGRGTRRLLELLALISWTADLDRLSVHAMARMIRSQGGLSTGLSTRGGAQGSLLVEGMTTLVDRLAAELRVRTGHRVLSISRDDRGVTVRTASGDLRAR